MVELNALAMLANLQFFSLAEGEDSLIKEACLTLLAVTRPDLDKDGKKRLTAFLDCRAYLQVADILVPPEWSYIITRHRNGKAEAILHVAPGTATMSSMSDSGGLALLSALAKLVLSPANERTS